MAVIPPAAAPEEDRLVPLIGIEKSMPPISAAGPQVTRWMVVIPTAGVAALKELVEQAIEGFVEQLAKNAKG